MGRPWSSTFSTCGHRRFGVVTLSCGDTPRWVRSTRERRAAINLPGGAPSSRRRSRRRSVAAAGQLTGSGRPLPSTSRAHVPAEGEPGPRLAARPFARPTASVRAITGDRRPHWRPGPGWWCPTTSPSPGSDDIDAAVDTNPPLDPVRQPLLEHGRWLSSDLVHRAPRRGPAAQCACRPSWSSRDDGSRQERRRRR